MIVKIEGKEHRQGTSRKTGRDYDFFVLHFVAPQAGVEGNAAVQKIVDPSIMDYDKILVGLYYELTPDLNGSIIKIEAAKT